MGRIIFVGLQYEIMSGSAFNASFGASHQYSQGSAYAGSDKKGQSQPKKIFCAYHPVEFLTNFCIDRECLMPLCPTCVVQHTEEHYESGQKPTYVNLNDALGDSRQRCYSSIVKLEEFARRNAEMGSYIQGLPEYIRKQLADCKEKIYRFVDEKFEAFEGRLIEEIRAKYDEEGVYSRKECEQVREVIGTEIDILYEKITQLKGDQCLSALIRFYQTDEKKLQEQIAEIVEYIERNRNAGGLYISINAEELAQGFGKVCERLVSVQYIQQDESRSLNSTRNLDQQGSTRKPMSGSQTAKGQGKSGMKEKLPSHKNLSGSQAFSSHSKPQQEKMNVYYPSPLKTSPHF